MALKIRRISKLDLPFILEVRNECRSYLHDDRFFTKDQIEQWFETTVPVWYIIYIEEDGQKIGYFRTDGDSSHKIQIGCDIHKDFRGKGYATIAYKHFINYLFTIPKKKRIHLEVLASNTRAINLYKKLGFIEEGRKRQDIYRNGQYIDSIIMGLLKNEYKNPSF